MHNTLNYKYSDLDLDFTAHAVTKDILRKYDDEAVKRSVRNLITTMHYERPFHPEKGCMVHSLLFENITPITAAAIQRSIADTLWNFEPRIRLVDVHVKTDPLGYNDERNTIEVKVVFNILPHTSPVQVTAFLKEVR